MFYTHVFIWHNGNIELTLFQHVLFEKPNTNHAF